MELVNIPSTLEDPEYRYKMPRLISKFEGRGDAIKTCIVNMGDVSRALRRPPQYATKWFGSALGVDSEFVRKEGDGGCCYIHGSHDVSAFQSLLDEFIEKYVCCKQCRLPEVDIYISNGEVLGGCKACGWTHAFDNKHSLTHFIAKYPPDESGFNMKGYKGSRLVLKADSEFSDFDLDENFAFNRSGGSIVSDREEEGTDKKVDQSRKEETGRGRKRKKEKKGRKGKREKSLQDEAFNSWFAGEEANDRRNGGEDDIEIGEDAEDKVNAWPNSETISTWFKKENCDSVGGNEPSAGQKTSAARHEICRYDSSQVANAIKVLTQYVKDAGELLTVEHFFDELRCAQLADVFDHKVRLYVVLEAFLGNSMNRQSVLAHKEHIEQAISNASMRAADVLWAFNAHLQAHPSGAKGFPLVLKTIYDEEWAFEEDILEYYRGDKFVLEPGFELAQKHAEPFLQWLCTVESDDEDDDNE